MLGTKLLCRIKMTIVSLLLYDINNQWVLYNYADSKILKCLHTGDQASSYMYPTVPNGTTLTAWTLATCIP